MREIEYLEKAKIVSSLEPLTEAPQEWRREAKGTQGEIKLEMELCWEWQEAVDAERFWDAQEDAEVQGEALVETPVQETDGVYERHEAWNLSQGLMRAGLKDGERCIRRKQARRVQGQEPVKTRRVIEFVRGAIVWGGRVADLRHFKTPTAEVTRASGEKVRVKCSNSVQVLPVPPKENRQV